MQPLQDVMILFISILLVHKFSPQYPVTIIRGKVLRTENKLLVAHSEIVLVG